MGWILVAGFVVWLLSRCIKKQVDATKDDFSGNTVGSLFLLENLIDHPDRDDDREISVRDDWTPDVEEWFDDDR
jgi:hypothetical protein